MIQTRSGHQVTLDDKRTARRSSSPTKAERTLTFDVKNKKFLIEGEGRRRRDPRGEEDRAPREDLGVKTKRRQDRHRHHLRLNVKDKASVKAGPQLNLKASRVNIN